MKQAIMSQPETTSQTAPESTGRIKLKPVNSDIRRGVVLATIVNQLTNGEDLLSKKLFETYAEEALELQERFLGIKKALEVHKIKHDDLQQQRNQRYEVFINTIEAFWSALKMRHRKHQDAARIFRTFALKARGTKPRSRSYENLRLYAKAIIKGAVLAREKGWPLPSDYPVREIAELLDRIENDEIVYYSLPRERRDILNQLDQTRQDIALFFQKLRASLRLLTIGEKPAQIRNQHRSFGFEYHESAREIEAVEA